MEYKRETLNALRMGAAAVITLLVAAYFRLEHANLAVWTSFMVMVRFSFTAFQKGVERFLGRVLGIVVGLVLVTVTRNAWGIGFILELVALALFFYVYFSDRLAYTFLNAGLYLAVIMELGRADAAEAITTGWHLTWAVLTGVLVADLVLWFTGTEEDFRINTTGQSLWPVDAQRVNKTLMLVTTVALTQVVTTYLAMPTDTTIISVMVLTIMPDMHTLFQKGKLRLAGAGAAVLYASVAMVLLYRAPHFPLLVLFLFLGIYLAGYWAQTGKEWDYAGVQMGLVLPMVLISHPNDLSALDGGISRMLGVLIALCTSLVVSLVWAAAAKSRATASTDLQLAAADASQR